MSAWGEFAARILSSEPEVGPLWEEVTAEGEQAGWTRDPDWRADWITPVVMDQAAGIEDRTAFAPEYDAPDQGPADVQVGEDAGQVCIGESRGVPEAELW